MNTTQVPPGTARSASVAPSNVIALLPILAPNLYAIFGVLYLNWSVADLFFWFWCEFVLAGAATFLLLVLCPTADKRVPKSLAGWAFGFAFLYILFFATLFAALAYKGEWESWGRFPEFLAQKKAALALLIGSFAIPFGAVFARRRTEVRPSERIALLFNRKCFVVVGLYALFLIHGWIWEWTTGARSLSLSGSYLKAIGVTLLVLKMFAEAGLFDRFCKQRANRV